MRYENIEDHESLEEFAKRIETLEEAIQNNWNNYEYQEGNLYSTAFKSGFELGVKWFKERASYSEVTRVEVIQHSKPYNGRAYTNYNAKDVEIQFQDNGTTLKIFLK